MSELINDIKTSGPVGIGVVAFVILLVFIAIYSLFFEKRAPDYNTAKDCRDHGYVWHEVDGCMTNEVFIDNYIDN